jgi:hypothetical protein
MPLTNRTRRILRARKRGYSVEHIAAKEGISERTVYRALSSPAFQKSLAVQLATVAQRRLRNADLADDLAHRVLTVILDRMKVGEKITLTPKDIAYLGKFSHVQYELGAAYLNDATQGGIYPGLLTASVVGHSFVEKVRGLLCFG